MRIAAGLGLFLFVSVAHAADWKAVTRQCAEEIDRDAGCTTACVNKLFPEVVRCANARLRGRIPQDKLEMCIRQVQNARTAKRACELCGDPAAEVLECAGG